VNVPELTVTWRFRFPSIQQRVC